MPTTDGQLQGAGVLRRGSGAAGRNAQPGLDHSQRGQRGPGMRLRRQGTGRALPGRHARQRAGHEDRGLQAMGRGAHLPTEAEAPRLARERRLEVRTRGIHPLVRRYGGDGGPWRPRTRARRRDSRSCSRRHSCRRRWVDRGHGVGDQSAAAGRRGRRGAVGRLRNVDPGPRSGRPGLDHARHHRRRHDGAVRYPNAAVAGKVVAEGAGALAYAALEQLPAGPKTAVVVSGGNIDPKLLAALLSQ